MHVLTLPALRPDDLLRVRAASRTLAERLGLDEQDQVRLATALSEVGREVLPPGRDAQVRFELAGPPAPCAIVSFLVPGAAQAELISAEAPGITAARRLVDDVAVVTGEAGGIEVRVVKSTPANVAQPAASELAAAVRAAVPVSPLEELWQQNRELAAALAAVTEKELEATRLNAELEETNRGVMALYSQLSEELDETNRGVVALYAELDDKSVALQEASRAKSRFFAAVSHELRSPVNSILGLTRVLTEPDADPLTSEQRHQIDLVRSAADDLLSTVNQLLDLARAEAGHLEPQVAPFDLAELAGELRGSLRPLVDEDKVELVTDVDPALPALTSDRALVAQVLRNLLVNAVRFTERGTIRLSAELSEPGQHVSIAVSDTGIGIPAEHQQHIFEEFYQVRGPLQARSKGSGLGLAHTSRLVDLLDGELRLRSDPGVGSTFTVVLPVHWNAAASGPSPSPAVAVAHRSVLIVDDDEGFRTALRGMLQGASHRVTEAASGEDALLRMRASRPDVVFLDLRLPDLDGSEVLARMATEPPLRDVPVVMVTSADLRIEGKAPLRRAHALLAKSDITPQRVQHVLADLSGTEIA